MTLVNKQTFFQEGLFEKWLLVNKPSLERKKFFFFEKWLLVNKQRLEHKRVYQLSQISFGSI